MFNKFNPYSYRTDSDIREHFFDNGVSLHTAKNFDQEKLTEVVLKLRSNRNLFDEAVRELYYAGSIHNNEDVLRVAIELGALKQAVGSVKCFAFTLCNAKPDSPIVFDEILNELAQTIPMDELLTVPYFMGSNDSETTDENVEKRLALFIRAAKSRGCGDSEILNSLVLGFWERWIDLLDPDFTHRILRSNTRVLDQLIPDGIICQNIFGKLFKSHIGIAADLFSSTIFRNSAKNYIRNAPIGILAAEPLVAEALCSYCGSEFVDLLKSIDDEKILDFMTSNLVRSVLSSSVIENNPSLAGDFDDLCHRICRINREYNCGFTLNNSGISLAELNFTAREAMICGRSRSLEIKINNSGSSLLSSIRNMKKNGYEFDNSMLLVGLFNSIVGPRLCRIYDDICKSIEDERFNQITNIMEKCEVVATLIIQELGSERIGILNNIPKTSNKHEILLAASLICMCMDNQKVIDITNGDKKVLGFLAESNCLKGEFLNLLSKEDKVKKLYSDFRL